MTKYNKIAIVAVFCLLATPLLANAQAATDSTPALEIALNALYFLTLLVVIAVIYNFSSVMISFGGLIGRGLNLIGAGVIVLSCGVILRILSAVELNYLETALRHAPQIYNVFMACLQVVGLLLVVWGFKGLASIYKEKQGQKKTTSKNRPSNAGE